MDRLGQHRRTALITGASSGIGAAFAELFAAEGFDLVMTARREDRLRAAALRLEKRYGIRVHVIAADLSERNAPAQLCENVAARGLAVDVLVNNAGYGIPGVFTALCPGFTLSEFHDVTGTRANVTQLRGWLWMDAPTVARQGFDAVMAGTPIYVTGRINRAIAFLARHLPERLLVAIGRRTARHYRKS